MFPSPNLESRDTTFRLKYIELSLKLTQVCPKFNNDLGKGETRHWFYTRAVWKGSPTAMVPYHRSGLEAPMDLAIFIDLSIRIDNWLCEWRKKRGTMLPFHLCPCPPSPSPFPPPSPVRDPSWAPKTLTTPPGTGSAVHPEKAQKIPLQWALWLWCHWQLHRCSDSPGSTNPCSTGTYAWSCGNNRWDLSPRPWCKGPHS